ncbi:branched chain amino acid ABC transporter [Pseudomonas aeruginosa]|nr:branched chain amino acid ABC transporter [Pseudomonas aeruginosa]
MLPRCAIIANGSCPTKTPGAPRIIPQASAPAAITPHGPQKGSGGLTGPPHPEGRCFLTPPKGNPEQPRLLPVVHPPMTHLKGFDLLALGFMTFALFLGAGNIIFPPSAGMAAGRTRMERGFRLPPYRCRPAVADGGRPGPGRRRYWPPDPADRAARGSGVRHRRLSCHRPAVRHPAYSRGVLRDGRRALHRGRRRAVARLYRRLLLRGSVPGAEPGSPCRPGRKGHHAGAAVGPAGPWRRGDLRAGGSDRQQFRRVPERAPGAGLPAGLPDHGYPRCAGLRYRHRHRHSRPRHQRQPAGHALFHDRRGHRRHRPVPGLPGAVLSWRHQPGHRRRRPEWRTDPHRLCAADLWRFRQPVAGGGHHPGLPGPRR